MSILIMMLGFTSCKQDEQVNFDDELQILLSEKSATGNISFFQMPSATDLSSIPQDPLNPLTSEKVELGKLLYHETALGIAPMQDVGEATFSCASCHFASAGFQAGRFQGIGEGGMGFGTNGEGRILDPAYQPDKIDVQPLRSPSTLNVAYQKNMLWNGQFGATGKNVGTDALWPEETPIATNKLGFEGVEVQAIAGLGVHRMGITDVVQELPEYKTLFDKAFSDIPEVDRYTKITTGMAIAAYERTLLPNESPFQKYLKGDNSALTDQQKLGAMLFLDQANCVACHTGPALNEMEFRAIGAGNLSESGELTFKTPVNDPSNLGRGQFTKNPADNYKFKTPQLYNLKDSPFYFHGSTFTSLRAVIDYKNNAVAENSAVAESQLDPLFKPLNLTLREIEQLTDFIENGLYDPNLNRYQPTSLPSGNCFPMNDTASRNDLGCD